jgi:HlyD family secretion protein
MTHPSPSGACAKLGTFLLLAALLSGCGQVSTFLHSSDDASLTTATSGAQMAVSGTPVPAGGYARASTPRTGQQSAAAYRGSIEQTISLDGVVASKEEVQLFFAGHGRVQDVRVKTGQQVDEGELLMQTDAVEIERQLSSAKARVQTSEANLAQAQAQALARQQTNAQRTAADQAQRNQAIIEAQSAVRRAQADYDQVKSGAGDVDRRSAQNGVDVAQGLLDKALADQERVGRGAAQSDIDAANRDVTALRIAADKAQSDLAAVTGGPDPFQLRAAQRAVDSADGALRAAQAAKLDPKADAGQKAAHDLSISNAQINLQTAQDQLDRLQLPTKEVDVAAARQRVAEAKFALSTAQERLSTLQDGPDQTALDAAQASVDSATRAVGDAQARLHAVVSHPTPAELADARDRLARAQASLDRLRQGGTAQATDEGGVDLGALQKAVAVDQDVIAQLQQDLESTRLIAPFAGTVVSVRARAGDDITTSKAVVILAKPGAPVVRVILDDQSAQVAVGQRATVQLDPSSKTLLSATVKMVSTLGAQNGNQTAASIPIATLDVDWGSARPAYGTPVQLAVTLQQHDNALLVPKGALRNTGGKTFVETVEGTSRHMLPVQVGISAPDAIEIVGGLSDGQPVLIR